MQYVYLLRAGNKHYKVGISHNVKSRVSGLQTYNPDKIEIITSKYADINAYTIEQELHRSLVLMKAKGANEWFELTPEQAIDLAIQINNYPDVDISERVTLARIVQHQKHLQKQFDKKLDYIINTYQKTIPKVKLNPPIEKAEPVAVDEKVSKEDEEKTLFSMAKDIVTSEGRGSTSLLQRRLRIGYGRAARILEALEEQGIVSGADGSHPRRILV